MRTFMPVNILIGAALLGGAGAAYASESEAIIAQDQLWSSDLKFDLLRDCPAAQVKRLNLPLPANGHTTAKSGPDRKLDGVSTREELGPSWTFQRGSLPLVPGKRSVRGLRIWRLTGTSDDLTGIFLQLIG